MKQLAKSMAYVLSCDTPANWMPSSNERFPATEIDSGCKDSDEAREKEI